MGGTFVSAPPSSTLCTGSGTSAAAFGADASIPGWGWGCGSHFCWAKQGTTNSSSTASCGWADGKIFLLASGPAQEDLCQDGPATDFVFTGGSVSMGTVHWNWSCGKKTCSATAGYTPSVKPPKAPVDPYALPTTPPVCSSPCSGVNKCVWYNTHVPPEVGFGGKGIESHLLNSNSYHGEEVDIQENNLADWTKNNIFDPNGNLSSIREMMSIAQHRQITGRASLMRFEDTRGVRSWLTKFSDLLAIKNKYTDKGDVLLAGIGGSADSISVDHEVILADIQMIDSKHYELTIVDPNVIKSTDNHVKKVMCNALIDRTIVNCVYENPEAYRYAGTNLHIYDLDVGQADSLRAKLNAYVSDPKNNTTAQNGLWVRGLGTMGIKYWIESNANLLENNPNTPSSYGNCFGWSTTLTRMAYLANFVGKSKLTPQATCASSVVGNDHTIACSDGKAACQVSWRAKYNLPGGDSFTEQEPSFGVCANKGESTTFTDDLSLSQLPVSDYGLQSIDDCDSVERGITVSPSDYQYYNVLNQNIPIVLYYTASPYVASTPTASVQKTSSVFAVIPTLAHRLSAFFSYMVQIPQRSYLAMASLISGTSSGHSCTFSVSTGTFTHQTGHIFSHPNYQGTAADYSKINSSSASESMKNMYRIWLSDAVFSPGSDYASVWLPGTTGVTSIPVDSLTAGYLSSLLNYETQQGITDTCTISGGGLPDRFQQFLISVGAISAPRPLTNLTATPAWGTWVLKTPATLTWNDSASGPIDAYLLRGDGTANWPIAQNFTPTTTGKFSWNVGQLAGGTYFGTGTGYNLLVCPAGEDLTNSDCAKSAGTVNLVATTPSITVTAPIKDQKLPAGSSVSLTWTATPDVKNVAIIWTKVVNGASAGTGWITQPTLADTVYHGIPNTGWANWDIPSTFSGNYIIQIFKVDPSIAGTGATNPAVMGGSAQFSVIASQTTPLAFGFPNKSTSWTIGTTQTITWSGENAVKSNFAVIWTRVVNGAKADTGWVSHPELNSSATPLNRSVVGTKLLWDIPSSLTPGDYVVQVFRIDSMTGAVGEMAGSEQFKIIAPTSQPAPAKAAVIPDQSNSTPAPTPAPVTPFISVNTPAGANPGQTINLSWSSSPDVKDVSIIWTKMNLATGGADGAPGWVTKASDTSLTTYHGITNTGSTNWTVPNTLTPGTYIIQVFKTDSSLGGTGATSLMGGSGQFQISAPTSFIDPFRWLGSVLLGIR